MIYGHALGILTAKASKDEVAPAPTLQNQPWHNRMEHALSKAELSGLSLDELEHMATANRLYLDSHGLNDDARVELVHQQSMILVAAAHKRLAL